MAKKPNILSYNLDFIKDTITRNIGDFNNSGSGYVTQLYNEVSQKDAWFKKDVDRRKYGNYLEYAQKMYFNNQVWTPFINGTNYVNDLGNYLYPLTNYPDTHLGDVSHDALMNNIAHSMYTYYTTRTENGNQTVNAAVSRRKSITMWVAKCFSIEGYLESGVRVAVDPMTGFIAENEAYRLSDEQNSNITAIQLYAERAGIDPFTQNSLTWKYIEVLSKGYKKAKILVDSTDLASLSQNVIDTMRRMLSQNQFNMIGGTDNTYGTFYATEHQNTSTATLSPTHPEVSRPSEIYIAEENKYIQPDGSIDNLVDVFNPLTIDVNNPNMLLDRTRMLFRTNANNTLLARFCTEKLENDTTDPMIQSAVSRFGLSHGRNLLLKNPDNKTNGYNNPYCRVWTFHHQYDRFSKTIRPFGEDYSQKALTENFGWDAFRAVGTTGKDQQTFNGAEYLDKNTVLDYSTNMVRITPRTGSDGSVDKESIKRCMFSLENLAWRDVSNMHGDTEVLTPDQRGPFGGRIMWFPPYGLTFSEQTNIEYSSSSFIGRGEKIHSYVDTERTGQLSFKLLADHPAIINYWKGDGESVDEDNADLLRFFAGCANLNTGSGGKIKYKIKPTPDTTPLDDLNYIRFFVFFPNNYTGDSDKLVDDISTPDRPILYLLDGLGTQEAIEVDDITGKFIGNPITLPMVSITTDKSSRQSIGSGAIYLKNTDERYFNVTPIGGYEMWKNPSHCLSQINQKKAENSQVTGWTCQTTIQNLTDEQKKIMARGFELVKHGDKYYMLLGIAGLADKYRKPTATLPYGYYEPALWLYRIDQTYQTTIGEKLEGFMQGQTNYADTTSFGLNSKQGKDNLLQTLIQQGSPVIAGKETFVSFSEMAKAIMSPDTIRDLPEDFWDKSTVNNINSILTSNTIVAITTSGSASAQGTTPRNTNLANNRSNVIKGWLASKLRGLCYAHNIHEDTTPPPTGNKSTDSNNTLLTKFGRSTEVRLYYEPNEVYEKKNTINMERLKAFGILEQQLNGEEFYLDPEKLEEVKKLLNGKYTIERVEETATNNKTTGSYGNEYKFFSHYKHNDPFTMTLREKIKYFAPAYHSISPEGFNARLTFLQQCTRQGPTRGDDGNAYNLAFGRPPICVLRVGDFYYTKILITSLSINHDNTQWDMNPEGIGLQPMIADVSINFKFLGGSDLGGPIARLQNAVSYNYYANTGVYDLNAEQVLEYEKDTPNNEVIRPNNIIIDTKRLNN